MAKLDRLVWATGLTLSADGVTIGIRATTASALAAAESALPPGAKPSKAAVVDRLYSIVDGAGGRGRPGVRRFTIVYADAFRLARTLEPAEATRALEADLGLYVAEMAPRRVFLHAGVVAFKGRALVIPGSSGSGKTTLVAALLRAGCTYYSDEYAPIDRLGRVHPYPTPLSLRGAGGEARARCTAAALGAVTGVAPLRIGAIVSTRYHAEATFDPRRRSGGQAVLALLAHAVGARRDPRRVLATLTAAVRGTQAFAGPRGEAAHAAARLTQMT